MLEKIALQRNLITREQCQEAQEACKGASHFERALKDYFISRGMISPADMKLLIMTYHVLKTIRQNIEFGVMAVKLGFVDTDLMARTIEQQKKAAADNRSIPLLADVWEQQGIVTPEQNLQIRRNLVERYGMEIPAPPPAPEASRSRIGAFPVPGGMVLEIDDGAMNAFLYKTNAFDRRLTPDMILDMLVSQRVVYGVVAEEMIAGFIRSGGFRDRPFRVASGIPPEFGCPARVEYFFDTDPLKAGGVDKDGNIDFRDRGRIERVVSGTLLAEKFDFRKAEVGRNIFDEILDAPPAPDIQMESAAGTAVSPDGLKIVSVDSGRPRLIRTGKIQVMETLVVESDVTYETGHLDYDGDIRVSGSLKSGFTIRGRNVTIHSVDGGEIQATGDVVIAGNVNGATIRSWGNVSAKFIHNSRISCLGNLTILKEIIDSQVEISGAVMMPAGEIISSSIASGQGIHIRHLGTDKSTPCLIAIGNDVFTEKEISVITEEIIQSRQSMDQLREKLDSLYGDHRTRMQAASRLIHEMARAATDSHGKHLFARLEKELTLCCDKIQHITQKITEIKNMRDDLEDRLDDLLERQSCFEAWQNANPGKPVAVIDGTISVGTQVQTPQCQQVIRTPASHVRISEMRIPEAQGGGCEIQIHENTR